MAATSARLSCPYRFVLASRFRAVLTASRLAALDHPPGTRAKECGRHRRGRLHRLTRSRCVDRARSSGGSDRRSLFRRSTLRQSKGPNSATWIFEARRRPSGCSICARMRSAHHAAQISVSRSQQEPLVDLDVNLAGGLRMLEGCRTAGSRIISASSAAVYGHPVRLPIDENHPTHPINNYGVSKLAFEHYLQRMQQYAVSPRP